MLEGHISLLSRNLMNKTLVAVFDSHHDATSALEALIGAGFARAAARMRLCGAIERSFGKEESRGGTVLPVAV